MRNCFANEITRLAEQDDRIVLLSGDIGNRMFDSFKSQFPERFYNCGIAEAAMMSMAAGLALEGLRPFVYTITPFTTTRCLEQIKIGAAYHNVPVVIVGTGSGLSYAELGPTHYSFEDIAILRALPNINILTPCDKLELAVHINDALNACGPSYIRIGKKGEPDLHQSQSFRGIGKATELFAGEDVVILGIGPILGEAIKSAEFLADRGISVAVVSMGSIAPLDEEFLWTLQGRFKKWITLEEHSVVGGLGSTISEWLQQNNCTETQLRILGIPNVFIHELGTQEFMRERFGIGRDGLIKTAIELSEGAKR